MSEKGTYIATAQDPCKVLFPRDNIIVANVKKRDEKVVPVSFTHMVYTRTNPLICPGVQGSDCLWLTVICCQGRKDKWL